MFNNSLNARFSKSKELSENFIEYSIPFHEFSDILKSDFNYSPFVYNNNYRLEANSRLKDCNMIILDFDEGLSIEDAKNLFGKWIYILATTKSHQKQKDKKAPCDRFRIVLPTETSLDCSIEDYKILMDYIHQQTGCDRACKDIARFYYAYPQAEIFINESDYLFDWTDALYKAKKLQEINSWNNRMKIERKAEIDFDTSKGEYLNKNYCNDKFLAFFDFQNKFYSRGRNNYLYSVGRCLIDSGFNRDDTENAIFWINSQGDGIPESEITSTVFRSLKRFYHAY